MAEKMPKKSDDLDAGDVGLMKPDVEPQSSSGR
jgi:hypothetical protein